jgi:recombination protein RecR
MSEHIEKLAELFKEFPGIGERQAKRFVYYLLTKHPSYLRELSQNIQSIRDAISQCQLCFRYFEKRDAQVCDICSNPKTDMSTLLVVEKDSDLEALRRSGTYKGAYFVFGGTIPVADEKTIGYTRLRELEARVQKDVKSQVLKEIILAFALSPQGEYTDMYLKQVLGPLIETDTTKITSLGRGLSTGSELEYSDKDTLGYALQNRK